MLRKQGFQGGKKKFGFRCKPQRQRKASFSVSAPSNKVHFVKKKIKKNKNAAWRKEEGTVDWTEIETIKTSLQLWKSSLCDVTKSMGSSPGLVKALASRPAR